MNHDASMGGSLTQDAASLETALAEMMCALESSDPTAAADAVIGKYPLHASALRSCREDCMAIDGMVRDIRDAVHCIPNPPEIPGYRILGLHDEGGMGYIFRAHYERLDQIVALKVIRDDRPLRDEDLQRFQTEARCAADLDHLYIISVHDIGLVNERPYYAMELINGTSLKDHLAETGTFKPEAAARLMFHIADAMASAHRRGVVHRDLKPGNILIDSDGHPRIIDFGLAKGKSGDCNASDAFVGTPNYCSPEQADFRASEAGPASDVYSMGAILYELLTGQPPLLGANTEQTLKKVRHDEPPPVRIHNRDVPRDLETICMRCLLKDPAKRFADAHDLREELRRFLNRHRLTSPQVRHSFFDFLFQHQTDERISQIGPSLLMFQAFYAMCIIGVQVLLVAQWGEPLAWVLAYGSLLLLFGILKTDGSTDWLPGNPSERLLWSIWLGAITAHFMLGVAMRCSHGYVAAFHQTYALTPFLTGMAYFITGGSFWKTNLMWGMLWWVLGVINVTLVAQPWAPLVYISFSCVCSTHQILEQLRLARVRREGEEATPSVRISKA